MNTFCPLCKNKAHKQNRREGYLYYHCPYCKTLFLHPQPDKKKLNDYYKKTFSYTAGAANETMIRERSRVILSQLLNLNPQGKTILDIGSGYGYFLDEARKNRLKCCGIEPSKQLSSTSMYRYIDKLYCIAFEKFYANLPEEKFDFITLIHVIEHVPFPKILIKQVTSLLKPSGILYIETPNLNSHLYRAEKNNYTFLTPPDHLWVFSKKSFEQMIPDGFSTNKILTYSYPEHFMGILKAILKRTRHVQSTRLEMGHQKDLAEAKKATFFSFSFIKYLFFDQVLAKLFYRLLNIHYYGSILELYIRKK